jgi:cyclophilin family peptidyl-prolyl cis-trans isomerase
VKFNIRVLIFCERSKPENLSLDNYLRKMFRKTGLMLIFAVSIFSFACQNATNSTNSNGARTEAPYTKDAKPVADAEIAVIKTTYGTMKAELYSNVAPKMVARFKELANEGFYNGTTFHRVNPGLGIIQGGDPNSKDADPTNDGAGDSPKPNVKQEFSDIPFDAGILGAARKGGAPGLLTEEQAWDTANCQFFIMTRRQSQFDKRYTVFGKVIEGLNNAQVIAGAPREGERPSESIVIESITFEKK